MAMTPTELSVIISPVVAAVGIIVSTFVALWKSRVISARFLLFDIKLSKSKGSREDIPIITYSFNFELLNTGDRIGYFNIQNAYFKIVDNEFKDLKIKKTNETDSFQVAGGQPTARNIGFEIENIKDIATWNEGKISVNGFYLNHKGNKKKFNFEFTGSSEEKVIWRTKRDKTIIKI